MAALMQKCERRYGETECPFHPGNKVVLSCNECEDLVCLKCIASEDQQGHTFKEIEKTVPHNCNIIGQFIEFINSTLLPDLHKKINDFKKEKIVTDELKSKLKKKLKDRYKEISDLLNNGTIQEFLKTHMETLDNDIEKLCDNNTTELQDKLQSAENKEKDLTEFKTELCQVLEERSPVTVYDACQKVKQKKESFKLPDMPGLDQIDLVYDPISVQEFVKKALGEIKITSPCDTGKGGNTSQGISNKNLNPKHAQSVCATAVIPNEDPMYDSITPVTADTAWCVESRYDKAADTYYITNKVCMINSQGQVQKRLQTSAGICRLCLHPSTGVLYGIFKDNTIRTIDTSTGNTTTVLRCPYEPENLTLTPGGDIIVGELWTTPGHVYRYSPDGQLLHQSKEEYDVWDISYSAMNDQVAVACDTDGVTVMDGTLTHVLHTHNIKCFTAVYDVDGSLMIGDLNKEAILILDGKTFSTIKSFTLPEMSCPREIRLCGSSMWVRCSDPDRIVQVMFQ